MQYVQYYVIVSRPGGFSIDSKNGWPDEIPEVLVLNELKHTKKFKKAFDGISFALILMIISWYCLVIATVEWVYSWYDYSMTIFIFIRNSICKPSHFACGHYTTKKFDKRILFERSLLLFDVVNLTDWLGVWNVVLFEQIAKNVKLLQTT